MENSYLQKIRKIFEDTSDRYEVHKKCQPLLQEMAQSKDFLQEVYKKNLSDPTFLKKSRHYSTLSMKVFECPEFSMLINIFPPLPDRNTDVTFQSIHHHGSLLLSTVGIMGPGYSSILYKKGFTIDHKTEEAQMQIEKYYQNKTYEIGFVDTYQPHTVFYPSDFSATLVLWSDYKKSQKEALKKIGIINKLKKPLGKIARGLGLSKFIGVNKVEYFDFYTKDQKYYAMKEREAYSEAGSNENFLQNVFCFLQKANFEDVSFLENLKKSSDIPKSIHRFIDDLIQKNTIPDSFYEGHLNVPFVNLHKKDLIF
jgi:hypothetical protein